MKKNLGLPDKVVRFLIAAVLIGLSVTHVITNRTTTFIVWALGAILILAALDGTCPIYAFLGISTLRPEQQPEDPIH